jgi:hypothetical protein
MYLFTAFLLRPVLSFGLTVSTSRRLDAPLPPDFFRLTYVRTIQEQGGPKGKNKPYGWGSVQMQKLGIRLPLMR